MEEKKIRRFLVLVMIATMTSAASAAVTIEILFDGAPWPGGSEEGSTIISVSLLDDGMLVQLFSIGSSVAVNHGDYVEDSLRLPPGVPPFPIGPLYDGFEIPIPTGYTPVPVPADDVVFGFDFHVPVDLFPSTYISIDWSGSYGTVALSGFDRMYHWIPEPMTIVLLGLGGVLLSCRRKEGCA